MSQISKRHEIPYGASSDSGIPWTSDLTFREQDSIEETILRLERESDEICNAFTVDMPCRLEIESSLHENASA